MAPTREEKKNKNKKNNKKKKSSKKRKREVVVVTCPTDTFGSSRPAPPPPPLAAAPLSQPKQQRPKREKLLDWHKTAQEVRSLGVTAFVGQDKRSYEAEQYELLTGRKKKGQKMPLPLVRELRKNREAREQKRLEEAREAGVVIAKPTRKRDSKRKRNNTNDIYGPAPSIGFVKHGVYRVRKQS